MRKQLTVDRDRMLRAAESCSEAREVLKTLWPEEFTVIHDEYGSVYQALNQKYMVARAGVGGKILVCISGSHPDCASYYARHSGFGEQRVYKDSDFRKHLSDWVKFLNAEYVGHIQSLLKTR